MAGVSDIPYGASGRNGGGKSGRGRRKGNGGLVRTSVRAYPAGIFKGEDSDSGRHADTADESNDTDKNDPVMGFQFLFIKYLFHR